MPATRSPAFSAPPNPPRASSPAPRVRTPRAPELRHHPVAFTTKRAQKWVVTAALITAMVYAFRRIVENPLSSAGNHGSPTARITGTGSPPPPLAHWALAYGVGFLGLSILALGAPELAGALAVLELAGVMLTNGLAVNTDIQHLQATPVTKDPGPPPPIVGTGLSALGTSVTNALPGAPGSPSSPTAPPALHNPPVTGPGHRNAP